MNQNSSTAFRFAGSGCSSLTLFVPVEGRNARELLPEGFSLFCEASEKALLAFRVISFASLAFDGVRPNAAVMSEVALRIETPDGSDGAHFYVLSQASSNRELASGLRAAGTGCEFLGFMAFEDRDLGQGRSIEAGASWRGSVYSIHARTAEYLPAKDSMVSVSWWQGCRGPIRMSTVSSISSGALAFGEVLVGPGSDLSRLAGGEVASGAGHFMRFMEGAGAIAACRRESKNGNSHRGSRVARTRVRALESH
jgi:hypothetical protein